jgi:formate--tetrahydrofolate ligase
MERAEIVCDLAKNCKTRYKPTYDWNWDIPKKVENIAINIYGEKTIEFTVKAKDDLEKIQKLGLDNFPCVWQKLKTRFPIIPNCLENLKISY